MLDHEAFVSGRFDTGFVGAHFDAERFEAYRWMLVPRKTGCSRGCLGGGYPVSDINRVEMAGKRFAD